VLGAVHGPHPAGADEVTDAVVSDHLAYERTHGENRIKSALMQSR